MAIPPKNIQKLNNFLNNPDFALEAVQKASAAAFGLSKWIRAVVQMYEALLVVEPKKKQLADAEAKLATAQEKLAEKKAALKEVQDLLAGLQADLDAKVKEKEKLEQQVQTC